MVTIDQDVTNNSGLRSICSPTQAYSDKANQKLPVSTCCMKDCCRVLGDKLEEVTYSDAADWSNALRFKEHWRLAWRDRQILGDRACS